MAFASDLAGMEREMTTALDDAIKNEVEPLIINSIVKGVEYFAINVPVFSGYYQRNLRVSLTGDVLLDPPLEMAQEIQADILLRQSKIGVLRVSGSVLSGEARQALSSWGLGQEITVGTAVPYSVRVEEEGTRTMPQGSFITNTATVIRTAIDPSS